MSWSIQDGNWKNTNSLFKRRFRGRSRRGILNNLLPLKDRIQSSTEFWSILLLANKPQETKASKVVKYYKISGDLPFNFKLMMY